LGLGNVIFSVPMNGGLFQLGLATLFFISASLSLGLVISTIAKNQLQSMQMTIFVLLPSILLSGFIFPYEAMPKAAQWLAEVFPATQFMRLIRGVVLRDASVWNMWQEMLILLFFTVFGITFASIRFKKYLD
jgi:ABC-2 type transport system permease protein